MYNPYTLGYTNFFLTNGFYTDAIHMTQLGLAFESKELLNMASLNPDTFFMSGYHVQTNTAANVAVYTTDGYQRLITPGAIWCTGGTIQMQAVGGGNVGGYDAGAGYVWNIQDNTAGGSLAHFTFNDNGATDPLLQIDNKGGGQLEIITTNHWSLPAKLGTPLNPFTGALTNLNLLNGYIVGSTNYVPANWTPIAGQVKFLPSNNWLFAVSISKTNPLFQINP
jgi:hypothetical protein